MKTFVFNLGATLLPLVLLFFALLQKQTLKYQTGASLEAFVGGVMVGLGGIFLVNLFGWG
jgi:hypothetical protein